MTLMAEGCGLLNRARNVNAQKSLARKASVPSLVNSACYMQENGCDTCRHLYNL